jgi:hypothetical protein
MRLTLSRFLYRAAGIFGQFFDEQDRQICVTIEHSYDDGAGGQRPKIPAGTYRCVWRDHPTKGWAFELLDVPGCTGILIHPANWEKDLDGCIGVGETIADSPQGQMVTNSWRALARFLIRLHTVTEFTLIVQDAPAHESRRAA